MKELLVVAALIGAGFFLQSLGEDKAFKWLTLILLWFSAISIYYLTQTVERLKKQVDYIANNTRRLPDCDD